MTSFGCVVALALAAAGWALHSDARRAYTGLRVSGNRLLYGSGSGSGRPVQLRGVTRSGTEYECVNGTGFFQSPNPTAPDTEAMVSAMTSWKINVVRVPLNEDCWLGVNAPRRFSGIAYRRQITAYVRELEQNGLFVVLDLHWAAPGGETARTLMPMADAQHSPRFWRSVAATFQADPDVMFDLFNEPYGVSWSCWRGGCWVPAQGRTPRYRAAGMQQLVNAVRSTKARQPILLGGLDYALDLSGWLANEPHDPDHALIASVHTYGGESPCAASCLSAIAQAARHVPVVFGELGELNCRSSYVTSVMQFADRHRIGYLGWAWDTGGGWTCTDGPALIKRYDGTPTEYGAGFRAHLAARGAPVRPVHPPPDAAWTDTSQ